MSGFTPMIEQYRSIKKEYADCILFFRLGDFYEMFFEDAEKASRELDIVLTARDGGQGKIPMCGIPYHAAGNYIGKLLEKGYRVAICDQVEDPKEAKGIVRREVTRVVTPGTVLDDNWLSDDNNYLIALSLSDDRAGLAYIDLSTGEFGTCQFIGQMGISQLQDEIARLRPTECIIPRWSSDDLDVLGESLLKGIVITEVAPELFTRDVAALKLEKYFGKNAISVFDMEHMPEGIATAGAIIGFIEDTQKTMMNHIKYIKTYQVSDFMGLDKTSRRNLELTSNQRDGKTEGSLISVIDATKTAMGKRQLRAWLEQPLLDTIRINERLDAVEELIAKRDLRDQVRDILQNLRDVERIGSKIGAGIVNPRELLALKSCLEIVPELIEVGNSLDSALLVALFQLNSIPGVKDLLQKAIDDNSPPSVRDGGMIKTAYDSRVDELRKVAYAGDQWLIDYEKEQRETTGIKSLKVGYTKVFGYYLEITRANIQQAPPNYVRKQTLVNAERFITEELKRFENDVLGAKDKLIRLEQEIYTQICADLLVHLEEIQTLSWQLAQIDALASLAESAFLYNYVRPEVLSEGPINIKGGRHPVVERTLGDQRFVPNETLLDSSGARLGIVTGPNMGGKSTYLRQVALIVIMAQIGSFVPADAASIGLIDRVFTRVGASDDLATGQSTFMVEMVEVANILRYSTRKSLLLLDEVGRGTSTFDGMSIARALAEHLAQREGVRALFATHYHELTDLADKYSAIFNLCVSVKESGDEVVFLKKVLPGKADRSYGIHVARLAGLPLVVTERAKEILASLEEQKADLKRQQSPVQPSLFGDENNSIIDSLRKADINKLTPLEALNLLQEWKQLLVK
ncbi:MAG: DNA mismatch repair protein MutS [Ignavibacteriales bacterium]